MFFGSKEKKQKNFLHGMIKKNKKGIWRNGRRYGLKNFRIERFFSDKKIERSQTQGNRFFQKTFDPEPMSKLFRLGAETKRELFLFDRELK